MFSLFDEIDYKDRVEIDGGGGEREGEAQCLVCSFDDLICARCPSHELTEFSGAAPTRKARLCK